MLQRSASVRDVESSKEFDYLRDEIAARLVDRINDIQREFPVAVDLGANTGNIAKQLSGHGGIKKLFMVEGCRESFPDCADRSHRCMRPAPICADYTRSSCRPPSACLICRRKAFPRQSGMEQENRS